MTKIKGHISQIIGPVIDVFFNTEGQEAEKVLPKIHDALQIVRPNGTTLVVEVQQHIGEDTVRCVAMDNTDGLQRGLEAVHVCVWQYLFRAPSRHRQWSVEWYLHIPHAQDLPQIPLYSYFVPF